MKKIDKVELEKIVAGVDLFAPDLWMDQLRKELERQWDWAKKMLK